MNPQREVPHLSEATERVRLFEDAVLISRLAIPLMVEDGESIRSTRNPLEILGLIHGNVAGVQQVNQPSPTVEQAPITSERRLWELGMLASGTKTGHSPYFVR